MDGGGEDSKSIIEEDYQADGEDGEQTKLDARSDLDATVSLARDDNRKGSAIRAGEP